MKVTIKHLVTISFSAVALACTPKEPVKYLALSFDDGPNLTTESKMLDVLAKHKVPATFFVIGNNINEESAENIKRARNLGCEIANHSLTHSMMSQMDEAAVKAEIEAHICICFVAYTIMLELERILKAAGSHISLDQARFLAEKIYQIDYVNPYDKKHKSVLLHTKEEPEVTELLNIISANC